MIFYGMMGEGTGGTAVKEIIILSPVAEASYGQDISMLHFRPRGGHAKRNRGMSVDVHMVARWIVPGKACTAVRLGFDGKEPRRTCVIGHETGLH